MGYLRHGISGTNGGAGYGYGIYGPSMSSLLRIMSGILWEHGNGMYEWNDGYGECMGICTRIVGEQGLQRERRGGSFYISWEQILIYLNKINSYCSLTFAQKSQHTYTRWL